MKTYLMLDDDAGSEAPAEPYAEALEASANGGLTIEVRRPERMAQTIAMISELAPDGLLLDVALTNALDTEGQPVGFDGIALAQQIRTLQTRARVGTGSGGLPEFPVVRYSKRDIVREYVNKDSTSDDLFDEFVDKSSINEPHMASAAASIVVALATDYPAVSAFADRAPDDPALAALLGCEPDFLARLDPRTLLGLRRPGAPAHILARFIVIKLFGRPGPLVNEALLAVRLGVDPARSEDWPAVLEGLSASQYRGVFSCGYTRWWMPAALDWWQREIDQDKSPARLAAADRVALLSARTGLIRLAAIEASTDSPGSRWWHRCARSEVAVDPAEGFPLLPVYGMETWHDTEYLCREKALRDPRNARLAASERARIDAVLGRRATP